MTTPKNQNMRLGIVVDASCDLPKSYLDEHNIHVLPITIHMDDATLIDQRNEAITKEFLNTHIEKYGSKAITTPFTVKQIHNLFLQRFVLDYDYVICLTVARSRSKLYDNATQASFSILNEYRPIRAAAGNNAQFTLRVIDTQNLFCAQGLLLIEAIRLRSAGQLVLKIRTHLEQVIHHTHCYLVPRYPYYVYKRAKMKGDHSVSLFSATLAYLLNISPLLYCNRGETKMIAKFKNFERSTNHMLDIAIEQVKNGLLIPAVCLSYGGDLHELQKISGYQKLRDTCAKNNIKLYESVMSLTSIINVGKGGISIGFASNK